MGVPAGVHGNTFTGFDRMLFGHGRGGEIVSYFLIRQSDGEYGRIEYV